MSPFFASHRAGFDGLLSKIVLFLLWFMDVHIQILWLWEAQQQYWSEANIRPKCSDQKVHICAHILIKANHVCWSCLFHTAFTVMEPWWYNSSRYLLCMLFTLCCLCSAWRSRWHCLQTTCWPQCSGPIQCGPTTNAPWMPCQRQSANVNDKTGFNCRPLWAQ